MKRAPGLPLLKQLRLVLFGFFSAGIASSAFAAGVTIVPTSGHPQIATKVGGTGFAANEAVDIYFDTTDEVLTVTNASGAFSNVPLAIPATATPGTHWITAIGRKDGTAYQVSFNVRTDWAQYRFKAAGKRFNPYENVLSAGNVAQLDIAWTFNTGAAVYSSPVIALGRLFFGSNDHNLYALNPATGKALWSAATGSQIQCSPAVANGKDYVNSYDGMLYAFNATTGAKLWSSAPIVDADSSPTVVNGIVYVGGFNQLALLAFDANTGALLWSAPVAAAMEASPVVANGVAYAVVPSQVYAFNAASGTQLWSASIPNYVADSSPVVTGGVLTFGLANGVVYGFKATNGSMLWSVTGGGGIYSGPAAANNTIYIAGRASDGNCGLFAIKPTTGVVLWHAITEACSYSSPAVANGVVYLQLATGGLTALNAINGSVLWSAAIGATETLNRQDPAPSVSDGEVYVGGLDGKLYAFALNGGGNAVYKRNGVPPSYSTLHPDYRLKPHVTH